MRKIKTQRSTLIKTNSPYRGPTNRADYSNFLLETVHDILRLSRFGLIDYRENDYGLMERNMFNFHAINFGEAKEISSNVSSASKIIKREESVKTVNGVNVEDLSSGWESYGGATLLESTITGGQTSPSGIRNQVAVKEGDVISVLIHLTPLSNIPNFTIGSENINGESDFSHYNILQNKGSIRLEKRLYCQERGDIFINIEAQHLPDLIQPASFKIESLDIAYLKEETYEIRGLSYEIRKDIEKTSSFIEDYKKQIKEVDTF